MPTENKLTPSLPEVKRWQLKGFIPGVEGESKAVFRPVVVLADDFDRIAAESDALQQRLNAQDERVALLEKVLAGLLFEFDDGVNGGREIPIPALDLARTLMDAAEFKSTEGASNDA
ncbi:hypothetical protein [Pseudomonas serbica]|uniref:hypothetical protein n=1 Tax=Pseudomonas serbica TaxID=2965074 RepID=UPI0039E31694